MRGRKSRERKEGRSGVKGKRREGVEGKVRLEGWRKTREERRGKVEAFQVSGSGRKV